MRTSAAASPVRADAEVVRIDRDRADPSIEVRFRIEPDEPVFAGHYPDFPIFPGVCVVECAHRAALAAVPVAGAALSLVALESARFTGPVMPGDVLTVRADWIACEGGWKYRATASTVRGESAKVKLRYRTEETS
ncbi:MULTISPECIES: 3-hydroxyacyl-ACP dehydratase FabZ family protein [unclassified Streptomyces]|uniref:3-hydroxyacyl-ACP dehydratase FabZ family protein n=1 Tax=unclassified Streptomyces TaxID=2593676 RepID=UPI0037AADCB2